MNPEIQAFAQHMREQGASAQEIDTYIKGAIERGQPATTPATGPKMPGGSFLAPVAQGLTMGLSDEILGGLEGANQALHGGSFQKGYTEGVAKIRNLGEQYRVEHPVASPALEWAGSIPTIAATGGAGAAEQGLGWGARLGKASLAGLKYGAAGGAGTAEGGLQARAQGALEGGIKSAFAAPFMEGGGALLGGFGRALGIPEGLSKGATALSEKVAPGKFSDFLATLGGSTGASGRASSEITNRLASEGSSPASVAANVMSNAASGSRPEILADYSPETASLTKAVTKEPGPGRAAVNQVLADRAQGTRGRLLNDVTQGKPAEPIAPAIEGMVRAREASAAQLFPKAYAAGASGVDDPAIYRTILTSNDGRGIRDGEEDGGGRWGKAAL